MRITLLFLILTTHVVFGQSSEDVRGSVCGSVLDENGVPASHVRIIAIRSDLNGSTGFPASITDQFGHYCIHGLRLTKYVLSAFDSEKGYPHRGPIFYFWQTPDPTVELSLLNPDASADFQIPFKAGFVRIQTPAVHTGTESGRVSFLFQVRSRPQGGTMAVGPTIPDGHLFTFLLPPDEVVLLTVTCADGHKWPEDSAEGKFLYVSSGATENITVPTSCF